MLEVEQPVRETELGHYLHGRGVERVSAEVPEEVSMLLEHEYVDPLARQHEPEHRPGRAAADHTARDSSGIERHGWTSLLAR
jgi:hypothetical protein